MRRALAFLAAALVAGCAGPGGREADRYFILEAGQAPGNRPQSGLSVRVAPTSAASFYATADIVFSRAPGTRGQYQYSHWTEAPQDAIHAALAERLEHGARPGSIELRTHLVEIYHDAAGPPGAARIALDAQLVDRRTGEVLARRAFRQSAPAPSYDAPGAVAGARAALASLLDEVVAWVDAHARGAFLAPKR